ncbi:hypothetical protein BC831DRAFT_450572 [Entophlyctis helioformis]|nr:hypothetical protein BC831DRAFT_450572 [Entophlyctis helioformis]
MDLDAKIGNLRSKIDVERKIKEGAENMLQQLSDPNAIQQCEHRVFDSQNRLEFLLAEMQKLQLKRQQSSGEPMEKEFQDMVLPEPSTILHRSSQYGSVPSLKRNDRDSMPDQQLLQVEPQPGRPPSVSPQPHLSTSTSTSSLSRQQRPSGSDGSPNASRSNTITSGNGSTTLPRRGSTVFNSILNSLGIRRSVNDFSSFAGSAGSMASISEGLILGPGLPAVTNFGYLRSDTILTPEKVRFKLREAKHRLDVEQKVRTGTERMLHAAMTVPSAGHGTSLASTQAAPDGEASRSSFSENRVSIIHRRRVEVEDKMGEAISKVNILTKAVQRYEGLYVDDEGSVDTDPAAVDEMAGVGSLPSASTPGVGSRPALSGKLIIRPLVALGLPGKKSSKTDLYVIVSIDNNQRAKSRTSRGKWSDELVVSVVKGSEVELAVYEKNGAVLSMLWFKLADFVQELNVASSSKITQSASVGTSLNHLAAPSKQDARASTLPTSGSANGLSNPNGGSRDVQQGPPSGAAADVLSSKPSGDGLEVWLDMEPMGQILVKLNFVPDSKPKQTNKSGVQRRQNVQKAAIRQGHWFVPIQTYQVLKCASCGDFLLGGAYQCQNCNYTCHKKCQLNVASKCVSKTSDEKDDEVEDRVVNMIKHRIPHRFEPTTNISVNWCCHCGLMLPLGKKQHLKCTECSSTCHKECMPLVPHFCGLPQEMISQLRSLEVHQDRTKRNREQAPKDKLKHMRQGDGVGSTPDLSSSSSSSMSSLDLRANGQTASHTQAPSNLSSSLMQALSASANLTGSQMSLGKSVVDLSSSQTDLGASQSVQHLPAPSMLPPPPPAKDLPNQEHDQVVANGFQAPSSRSMDGVPSGLPVARKEMLASSLPSEAPIHQQMQQRKAAPSKPRNDSMHPFKGAHKGVGLDDFNFLAVLGKGNFGKVMLAEEKYTKRHYAIKVLKKEFIIENDEVESTKAEKRVFLTANKARHPFLVNLHSSFQTESRIYFVMEFVAGGDLMWHIQQQQFSERRARYYAGQVLLALEYFHQNNVVYRDLKLDNILLTPEGHIKIADYGLCKENMMHGATTTTFCGTPEFMAPEILSERPYTRAVDWWAFGVLVYEMLLGQSPFKGDDEEEIFEAIMQQEIVYPPTLPRDAVNLLQKLLTKDPARRLGGGKNDAMDVKQHPFFAGVDWDAMLRLEIPPPFRPTVKSPTDTSNFDEEFTREMPVLTPCTSVLSVANQEEFRGFTYISDWAQEIRNQQAGFGEGGGSSLASSARR